MNSGDSYELEEQATTLLGRLAHNAPDVVEKALNDLPADRQQEGREAIARGKRWDNMSK